MATPQDHSDSEDSDTPTTRGPTTAELQNLLSQMDRREKELENSLNKHYLTSSTKPKQPSPFISFNHTGNHLWRSPPLLQPMARRPTVTSQAATAEYIDLEPSLHPVGDGHAAVATTLPQHYPPEEYPPGDHQPAVL